MFWVWMMVAYGLCFGLMNKATVLHGKVNFLDQMLSCAYCTGFHSGWMAWGLAALAGQHEACADVKTFASVLSWGLASAAFCYTVDTVLQRVESKS